ncbi:MAG TPA: sulfite exporter TauE/SafE family protein, partial [Blastocatellia bacterium]|nr:sulfite exporter TauE/SafE family protein [Blastocatellia bacterium]
TVTHTAGVFALGLITLFASKYILPETLTPVLTLVSGVSVVAIGISLIRRRALPLLAGRVAGPHSHSHTNVHDSERNHTHENNAGHHHGYGPDHSHGHDHGSGDHSHMPPGADGSPVTWRGLLALGVSGGIVPCPSALVVLLSAISLHRVGYGLLLVTAFSFGLAAVLTAVGLLFVFAGRLISKPLQASPVAKLIRLVPVLSSIIVTIAGAAICYEALGPSGLNLLNRFSSLAGNMPWFSMLSLLGIGFLLGLKHAVEADHLAAVTVIATESKSVLKSSLVGAVWGLGHTVSLSAAGIAVIVFKVTIGERIALLLEVAVGVMLITLGLNALRNLRRDDRVHSHEHQHAGQLHSHVHRHRINDKTGAASLRRGLRPLLVGMMHGLAGSAALVLLVVATTQSAPVALAYIAVFGLGSTGGMMLVSAAVSLPFRFARGRVAGAGRWVRLAASAFSVALGLFIVFELGVARWL